MSQISAATEALREALARAMIDALKEEGITFTDSEYDRLFEKLMDAIHGLVRV